MIGAIRVRLGTARLREAARRGVRREMERRLEEGEETAPEGDAGEGPSDSHQNLTNAAWRS